jgi:hypothetical protein
MAHHPVAQGQETLGPRFLQRFLLVRLGSCHAVAVLQTGVGSTRSVAG